MFVGNVVRVDPDLCEGADQRVVGGRTGEITQEKMAVLLQWQGRRNLDG